MKRGQHFRNTRPKVKCELCPVVMEYYKSWRGGDPEKYYCHCCVNAISDSVTGITCPHKPQGGPR